MNWRDVLWQSAKEILQVGGELRLTVNKRENKRVIWIEKFPANYIVCDPEVIIDKDIEI